MKNIAATATLVTAIALSAISATSALASSDPCDGVVLEGEVQIIPLDNSTEVHGRLAFLRELLGVESNPMTIGAATTDGWREIFYTEMAILTRRGQTHTVGLVKSTSMNSSCFIDFRNADFAKGAYRVHEKLSNGNLILSNDSNVPSLVVKKIK